MFWNKKKINSDNIKGFNGAIKAIKVFIKQYDWNKAQKGINEIKFKEQKSYRKLLLELEEEKKEVIDNRKILRKIERERKEYERKEKEIGEIEKLLETKWSKYNATMEKKLLAIRFKKVENEIDRLLGKKESLEATNILRYFLEQNKENSAVIKFYNKEKKEIQKLIEKQRKQEQNKIKQNTRYEALSLVGDLNIKDESFTQEKGGFFKNLRERFNSHKTIKNSMKSKVLLDEINMLLNEDDKMKRDIAERRLENIHQGLVKEIENDKLIGYDLYGKILGANKISGDVFGIEETKNDYKFFVGDATGHGIRAGFIVTMLNKLFNIHFEEEFSDMVYGINNQLKQDLESRNFVTGIFFDIGKKDSSLHYIGMGHEPMLVYRAKTKEVEKIVPGGLAMGIMKMKDKVMVRGKDLKMEDGDILLCFSDGLIEARGIDGEFYGINKVSEMFRINAIGNTDIKDIYKSITNDVKLFRGGSNFDDDLTIILVRRDIENDLISKGDKYIEKLKIKEGLTSSDVANLKGKTKKEIAEEMEAIKKKKQVKTIIGNLESLYYSGEMLKLKEESTRYIKDGYIDKKINYFLKKAMENENKYKITQKNKKIQAKYSVLMELYKKGDYDTVIKEAQEIVSKEGNI